MRNIFKINKIKEVSQTEEPKIATQEENLDTPLLKDSAPVDVRLDILNNYFLQCKENGIELTPEMAEKEISESLEIKQEQLLDKEIKDPEIKDIKRDTATEVNNRMSKKAESHQTVLKYLREKVFKSNYAKAAFVTAMLFLKFNPAQAENGEKKVEDKKDSKTEQTVKNVNPQDGGDKTFKASAEDFNRLNKKVKIEATTYFDNDKANLNDKAALIAEFDKFLSSINETNFQDIMDRPFYFKGSSSEVPRPEGNEKLTKDRLTSFRQAWQEAVVNHDFSSQLSSEHSHEFTDKEVSEIYPTNGPEKGVTRVVDLIDPATGKNFTSEKVAAMGDDERKALQDKCRYTNFEVGSSMFDLAPCDEFIILIDESGSMDKTKKNMANELRYLNEDKPITVGYFSSGISKLEKVSGSRQAAELMSKMPTEGSSSERIVSSAIDYLNKAATLDQEKLKAGEEISIKSMALATDEGIQDANYINKLAKIAEQTKTTVNFYVFYESGSKYIKISLTDLNKKIVKIAEAEIMSQQEQAAKNLLVQNERVAKTVDKVMQRLATADYDMRNDLEKAGIKGSTEEIKKQLLDKDFVALKVLEGSRYFKDLIDVKFNLLSAKSNLYKTGQLSVEKQLATAMKINVLEDKAGNAITFPIYP